MNLQDSKNWVSDKMGTFKVAKENCLPSVNTANTRKAISMGFARVAYRTYTHRQWCGNIPAKIEFEQLMLRIEDERLFSLVGNKLTEWARRFDRPERIEL